MQPLETVELPRAGLRLGRIDVPDLDVGRELFHWGRFEDEFADSLETWGAHWALAAGRKFVEFAGGAVEGFGYLRLYRTARNTDQVTARPVARVPLYQHRLYEEMGEVAVALDPSASYTMRALARRTGDGAAAFRLDLYLFDDTNPTEDPSSESIGTRTLDVNIPSDGSWHEVEVTVPESVFVAGDKHANMVMLYVALGVPSSGDTSFDIDKLSLIEWRPAQYMPEQYGMFDFLRNRNNVIVDALVSELR